jgi:5-formyltetrahydrofolate cyclo-ligase
VSPLKYQKDELRRKALAQRDAMSEEKRLALSRALVAYASMLFPTKETIAAFWPIRSEIDPRPLMVALYVRGNKLALPCVVKKGTMIFRLLMDKEKLLNPSFRREPRSDGVVIDPTTILLPLVAFDGEGNRIGYGGGYYDRTIARMHERGLSPRLIALAFNCQQVHNIPVEPHDVPLEAILTESGLRTFP